MACNVCVLTTAACTCMRAGAYQVFGFFRFIENLEVFNLPPDEPKPALPSGCYKMDLMVSCMHAPAGVQGLEI